MDPVPRNRVKSIFRCGFRRCVLPTAGIAVVALHLSGLGAFAQDSAPGRPATSAPAPSAKQLRLRAETAQLNHLAAQLQQALDNSGDDKLSLDVVRLSQQMQSLARQIEAELNAP